MGLGFFFFCSFRNLQSGSAPDSDSLRNIDFVEFQAVKKTLKSYLQNEILATNKGTQLNME